MTDQDKELQALRKEIRMLKFENQKLKHEITNEKMKREIARWEHCHRQDMEDNIRLKNQIAFLTGSDHLLEVPKC